MACVVYLTEHLAVADLQKHAVADAGLTWLVLEAWVPSTRFP